MVITSEPLVADLTFKGLFPRVSTFVVLQYVLVSEATVTRRTGKDFVFTIVLSAIVA